MSSTSYYYLSDQVTGAVNSYKRAAAIQIFNPVDGSPTTIFNEEIATTLPNGSVVTTPSTQIMNTVEDMAQSFPLINPADGTTIGTGTFGQAYELIYSIYIYLAGERDAAAAAAAAGS